MRCEDEPVIVREQQADDYEAIRHVYAEAFRRPRFRRPQNPGSVAPEVALLEALWEGRRRSTSSLQSWRSPS